MAVRVEKSGWIVEGNTLSELEMGIEAVQRALDKTADSPIRKAAVSEMRPTRVRAQVPNITKLQSTIGFLETIRDRSSDGGATAAELIQTLGLDGPKGLGGASGSVNHVIAEQLGFNVDEVYTRTERGPDGRRWLSGLRIRDAIECARDKLHKG